MGTSIRCTRTKHYMLVEHFFFLECEHFFNRTASHGSQLNLPIGGWLCGFAQRFGG